MNRFSIFSPRAERRCAQRIQKWQAFMGASERESARTTYLHLCVNFPLHGVSWLSAPLVFRRSSLFLHLSHVFFKSLSIFGGKNPAGARHGARRGRFRVAEWQRMAGAREALVKLMLLLVVVVLLLLLLRAHCARSSQPSSACYFSAVWAWAGSSPLGKPTKRLRKKSEPDRGRGLHRNSIRPRWSREGYFLPNFPQIGFHSGLHAWRRLSRDRSE